MPNIKFGETFEYSSDNFIKLKSKGDKVHFRLLNDPVYDGKHFSKLEDEWEVTACPRVNEKKDCKMCETFFELMKKAKGEKDEAVIKDIKKEANKFKATVTFYFPVINRETELFQIFQGPKLIFDKFNDELAAGIDVMSKDYVVTRTEKPGSDYYTLTRLDSSDTKPYTDKEKSELYKGKADIATLMGLKKEPKPKETTTKAPEDTAGDPIMEATSNSEALPWEE